MHIKNPYSIATLINYARAFESNLAVGAAVNNSDTTADCYDTNDDTNSDIGYFHIVPDLFPKAIY